VPLVSGDPEVEVEGCRREPRRDVLGPLDRKAVRWGEKIFEHERVELGGTVEPVGVEVDEGARSAMKREDREGGARDLLDDAETASEPLNECGLADAQVTVQRERRVGWECRGELPGEGLRLIGARCGHTGAELGENGRHRIFETRMTRRARRFRREVRDVGSAPFAGAALP